MTRRKKNPGPVRHVFSGQRLQQARIDAGMRREDLAAQAECGFSSVYLWEAGRVAPNANTLARLADVLGLAVDDLYDEADRWRT